MANILLIEPGYRSKFPPLGLLRLSTYHKSKGDCVTFARGKVPTLRLAAWHRIYISSLFTWELARTVETIRYYQTAVEKPSDIFVGGIAATLRPDFIRSHVDCTIIEGQVEARNVIEPGSPPLANCIPDYSLLNATEQSYRPNDAYFCRATMGCVRKCSFCAVPKLEPNFRVLKGWRSQLAETREKFGEQRDLVILDNNILACGHFERIIHDIREEGFTPDAVLRKRKRWVDFNQGLDARLITPANAKLLASICMDPVRLAFDHDGMEKPYRKAIELLAKQGFIDFTNYVLFNFIDDPASLYRRLLVNLDLSEKLGVRVTAFPMRYIPVTDVKRGHVSPKWHWRYLRGIQCVLLATHGVVSPNRKFFVGAFGHSYKEFLEILCMPDRYIIYRENHKEGAEVKDWRQRFRKLSSSSQTEFLDVLAEIFRLRKERIKVNLSKYRKFSGLLSHYFPEKPLPDIGPSLFDSKSRKGIPV